MNSYVAREVLAIGSAITYSDEDIVMITNSLYSEELSQKEVTVDDETSDDETSDDEPKVRPVPRGSDLK